MIKETHVTDMLTPQTFLADQVLKMPARTMTMVLEGEIGQDDLVDIIDMLERLAGQGAVRIVVDMTDVSHFDYRGVWALRRKAEVLRQLGGDMKLAGLSPYLHAIFRSTGANDAFDYFATPADALSTFDRAVFVHGG